MSTMTSMAFGTMTSMSFWTMTSMSLGTMTSMPRRTSISVCDRAMSPIVVLGVPVSRALMSVFVVTTVRVVASRVAGRVASRVAKRVAKRPRFAGVRVSGRDGRRSISTMGRGFYVGMGPLCDWRLGASVYVEPERMAD